MIETQELDVLKQEVSTLETQAQAVSIETPEQYKGAVDLVSRLKETGSTITKKKESITKPLNEALKQARALFAPVEAMFENAEAILKGKLLAYSKRINEEARAKEAEIAKKAESGQIQLPTAEKRMAKIERVETTTRGEVGQVQIKKVKKVRLVNRELVPEQYLFVDMVLVRKDALAGIAIPGIEVYEEETIAAR